MKHISERIVNLSDLEKILADISIMSQMAQNSSRENDRKELLCEIVNLADKAAHFEFHIESRITSLCSE